MASGRITTIGYGGYATAAFVERLHAESVQYVIDVRSAPYSRHRPEFCKDALQRLLVERGLRYVYMGDLLGGRPRDRDCYVGDVVDYGRVRAREYFRRGLERLRSAREQGLDVCLMCSEGQPAGCHRARLIGAALATEGIDIEHVLPEGGTSLHSALMRESDVQGELFAGPGTR